MERRWNKLGILAGGGNLPARVAEGCAAAGAPFAMIRLSGYADEATARFGGEECGLGELGRIVRVLKNEDCDAVVMAGTVRRPNFAALKPDWRGAALLPKVVAAARRGDGALLDVLVETFEAEGFLVIGAEEVSSGLAVPQGPLGRHAPAEADLRDAAKAAAIVAALGQFDVGQGAVVCNGFVLAIEAAEGTDRMLARCAELPASMRGLEPDEAEGPRGVLLKRPKPGQELRVDLPTIGPETVRRALAAGLSGIAVEAGSALLVDKDRAVELADEGGLFLYGFLPAEFDG
ncbi:LpxI family protein [Parvularcula oceani]|uniref:LpxI family protein n=1 Tax=Parvularcula oceani TaxID=1247963 RepID=UPI0004E0B747|nr:UDP-2,3-diacylglucosamine diphosphatase LpxI [Parvularcula oceani]